MHLSISRPNFSRLWLAPALALIAATLIVLPATNAVVLIGGALALIAVLRMPELALYALIFAVPQGRGFPLRSVGQRDGGRCAVAVVLALWLARMIAKERAIIIRWPPCRPALFLLRRSFQSPAPCRFNSP
jgi:hypothetical protein